MALERFVRSHVQLVGFSTVWIINQELAYILHRKVKPAVKNRLMIFVGLPHRCGSSANLYQNDMIVF